MKIFKDIAKRILPVTAKLLGKKIPVSEVLNKEIIICHYHFRPSKYSDKKCAYIQIVYQGINYVLITDSVGIVFTLEQLMPDDFPFRGTIIKHDKMYQFDRNK